MVSCWTIQTWIVPGETVNFYCCLSEPSSSFYFLHWTHNKFCCWDKSFQFHSIQFWKDRVSFYPGQCVSCNMTEWENSNLHLVDNNLVVHGNIYRFLSFLLLQCRWSIRTRSLQSVPCIANLCPFLLHGTILVSWLAPKSRSGTLAFFVYRYLVL